MRLALITLLFVAQFLLSCQSSSKVSLQEDTIEVFYDESSLSVSMPEPVLHVEVDTMSSSLLKFIIILKTVRKK